MSTATFNTLANFQIPVPCRILSSSCCLDKDLVILISRLGSLDRVSLWNTTQGSKIWEVEVGEDMDNTYIVDLAWSPDGMFRHRVCIEYNLKYYAGQSVAVLYDPTTVTIYSVQDGKKMVNLPVRDKHFPPAGKPSAVWWLRNEEKSTTGVIPDIFKRDGLIVRYVLFCCHPSERRPDRFLSLDIENSPTAR